VFVRGLPASTFSTNQEPINQALRMALTAAGVKGADIIEIRTLSKVCMHVVYRIYMRTFEYVSCDRGAVTTYMLPQCLLVE
jgi:hypothetical protein